MIKNSIPNPITKYQPHYFIFNPKINSPKFAFTPYSVKFPELYKVKIGKTISSATLTNNSSF